MDLIEWTRRGALAGMATGIAACALSPTRSRGPIDRQEFVSIGGIDQFVAMRGRDVGNPAVLVVHGGPGNAMSPFLHVFDPWTPHVTVISWDQRGAGKTFGRNSSETADITPERLTRDGIEIAEHVRAALGKDKMVLCGHSMGAMLGWRMLQARPDLFHAFIASGALINYERNLLLQEAYARTQAEASGDAAALKAMEEARSLPAADIRRPRPIRRWLAAGADDVAYLEKTQQPFISQAATNADARAWVDGQARTTAAGSPMLAFMATYDIAMEGMSAKVPVVVVQGREDRIAFAQPAREFVDALAAPSKRFLEIAGGHFACFTNPGEFVPALRTLTTDLRL